MTRRNKIRVFSLILLTGLVFSAATSEQLQKALVKARPDITSEEQEKLIPLLDAIERGLHLDPFLVLAVASYEAKRGEPAVDRRWKYDVQAIANNLPPGSVPIPGPWEDLLQVAQSLSDDLDEWGEKGGVKLALQAYFWGSKRMEDGIPLSQKDASFIEEVLAFAGKLRPENTPPDTEEKPSESLLERLTKEISKSEQELSQNLLKFSERKENYARLILFFNRQHTQEMANSISEALVYWSTKLNIDTRLIFSLLAVESRFNPTAVSSRGAQGLGQLMPHKSKQLGVSNPFDIEENIVGSILTLKDLLQKYPLELALAAYNAGEGAVRQYNGIPPFSETRNYVKKVLQVYQWLGGKVGSTRTSP